MEGVRRIPVEVYSPYADGYRVPIYLHRHQVGRQFPLFGYFVFRASALPEEPHISINHTDAYADLRTERG